MVERDFYTNYKIHIAPRVDFLFGKGKYIEAFILQVTVLEEEVKRLIKCYEELIINKFKNDKLISISFTDRNSDKSTLGQSIIKLDTYCTDKTIIRELTFFNGLRKNCIHHLLKDGSNNLDNIISINNTRFINLMIKLFELDVKLIKRNLCRLRYKIRQEKKDR